MLNKLAEFILKPFGRDLPKCSNLFKGKINEKRN